MKKIYSFLAAFLTAAVVLVACAVSENAQNVQALSEAVTSKNVAAAEEAAAKLYAAKDQLSTEEACGLASGLNGLAALVVNEDAAKAQDLVAKVIEVVDATVAKDAEGVKKFAETSTIDVVAIAQTLKDQIAAQAQQAAEQAQQSAENAEEQNTEDAAPEAE